MAVTSNRSIAIGNAGDVVSQQTFSAAANSGAPGDIDLVALSTGANTITPPTGARAATLIMPAGNTVDITLKGVSGDTGIVLHNTDPTSIAIDSAASTFVLNAASGVSIRILWT